MAGKPGMKQTSGGFGSIRKTQSGQYQATYADPDRRRRMSKNGKPAPVRHNAPMTFNTRGAAKAWLAAEKSLIERWRSGIAEWTPPRQRIADRIEAEAQAERDKPPTLSEFATTALARRRVKGRPLTPRTLAEHHKTLERHVYPTFGDVALPDITRESVEHWYDTVAKGKATTRRHAYSLLHSLMADAIDRDLITVNPVRIKGAMHRGPKRDLLVPEPDRVLALAEAMPENRQLMPMLAAWAGLRYGEVTELRRKDIDPDAWIIKVRRAAAEVRGEGIHTKGTKTDEPRDVPIPSHIRKRLSAHLLEYTQPGANGLLFPADSGGNLPQSSFRGNAEVRDDDGNVVKRGRGFDHAKNVAGLPQLRFHDLRHTYGTWQTQQGASIAEVSTLMGHRTYEAAMTYQHYTAARGQALADKLAALAGAEW